MNEEIFIPVGELELGAFINIPGRAKSIVIFAHGAGSSRFSSRNQFVAKYLNKKGLATLLFDLLTEKEDEVYENRFDIPLISKRLITVSDWVKESYPNLKQGFFGSSTGAAAAIIAAAERPEAYAVVSRGGRSDLAYSVAEKVIAPTLFIAGSNDEPIIDMNEDTKFLMKCETKIEIVHGAGHLFENSGELEKVAELTADWFTKHI